MRAGEFCEGIEVVVENGEVGVGCLGDGVWVDVEVEGEGC